MNINRWSHTGYDYHVLDGKSTMERNRLNKNSKKKRGNWQLLIFTKDDLGIYLLMVEIATPWTQTDQRSDRQTNHNNLQLHTRLKYRNFPPAPFPLSGLRSPIRQKKLLNLTRIIKKDSLTCSVARYKSNYSGQTLTGKGKVTGRYSLLGEHSKVENHWCYAVWTVNIVIQGSIRWI